MTNIDNTKIPYTEIEKNYQGLIYRFKSVSHLLTFVKYRRALNIRYSSEHSSTDEKTSGFNSHNTLEEAFEETAKNKPLPKHIRELILRESKSNTMEIVDDGGVVSVPHFLSNQPEHFETYVPKKRLKLKKKIGKKVFLCLSALGGVSEQEYQEYCQKAIEHIYTNYSNPQIVVCFLSNQVSEQGNGISEIYVEIPPYETNSIMRVLFADFFRRITFFIKEQDSKLQDGYGISFDKSDIKKCNPKYPVYSYYIPIEEM